MRWVTMLMPVALALAACGGTTRSNRSDDGGHGAAGGSAGNIAGGSAGSGAPGGGGGALERIDGAGGSYPTVPPGASDFFWRGGLGAWFVTTIDGQNADVLPEPIDVSDPSSGQAHHVNSQPGLGADLWVQLHHPQGTPVDLSGYTGLSFRARATGVETLMVASSANGQFFRDAGPFQARSLSLTQQWQDFAVTFDELELDSGAVSSIDFVVVGSGQPFDLWVADLAFACNRTCP